MVKKIFDDNDLNCVVTNFEVYKERMYFIYSREQKSLKIDGNAPFDSFVKHIEAFVEEYGILLQIDEIIFSNFSIAEDIIEFLLNILDFQKSLLKSLKFQDCDFKNNIINKINFSSFDKLVWMEISGCKIKSVDYSILLSIIPASLSKLYLGYNKLIKSTKPAFTGNPLRRLKNLEEITFYDSWSDENLAIFFKFLVMHSVLKKVEIGSGCINNSFYESICSNAPSWTHLTLSLGNHEYSDDNFFQLTKITTLEYLRFSQRNNDKERLKFLISLFDEIPSLKQIFFNDSKLEIS